MKLFAIIQIVVTLIGTVVLLEWRDRQIAASFAIGCAVVLFNVMSMGLLWFHVIRKKFIALSLAIIVFKYPILGIIIYKLLRLSWVDKVWLCVGLTSLVVTALFYAAATSGAKGDEEIEDENNGQSF